MFSQIFETHSKIFPRVRCKKSLAGCLMSFPSVKLKHNFLSFFSNSPSTPKIDQFDERVDYLNYYLMKNPLILHKLVSQTLKQDKDDVW